MSIFGQIPQRTYTPEKIADQLIRKGDMTFRQELNAAKQLMREVWYRKSFYGPDQPDGTEILTQMGTNARAAMAAAYFRVEMLMKIAVATGNPEVVNLAEFTPPYTVEYNEDGSVASFTPVDPPVEPPVEDPPPEGDPPPDEPPPDDPMVDPPV